MTQSQKAVIDMDGVLADFEGSFCKRFGNEYRNEVKLERRYPQERDAIKMFVRSPITYANLDVIPLGRQIVDWLKKGGYEIHIVSSRPWLCYQVTRTWLLTHKIPFDYLWVDNSHEKADEIARRGPVFAVDDLGSVAQNLQILGIPTILFSWPWNYDFSGIFPRISKFEQFSYQFERILGNLVEAQ